MEYLKKILLEKNHTGIQFLKYSICGGTALAADYIVSFLIAWLWLPALKGTELLVQLFGMQVESISDETRFKNFIIGSAIAFLVSNFVAYVLNVQFVFEAGKHSRWKEVGLFYLVSGVSVGIGIAIGASLIPWLGLPHDYSYIAKAISTTLINFVARKYFIFHG